MSQPSKFVVPKITQRIGCGAASVMLIATTSLTVMQPAQAGGLSEASRASLAASVALPAVLVLGTASMLRDAGQVSVAGLRAVGKVTRITLRAIGSGVETVVEVSTDALKGAAIVVGSVLVVTVAGAGLLLSVAGEALLFIADSDSSHLLHRSSATTGGHR